MLSYKLFDRETFGACTSHKGDYIAFASEKKMNIYKVSNTFELHLIDTLNHRNISCMCFNHTDELMYFLDTSGRFYIYDISLKQKTEVSQSFIKEECFDKIVLLPNDNCAWVVYNKLIIFDKEKCEINVLYEFSDYRLSSICYSNESDIISITAFDKKTKKWVVMSLTSNGKIIGKNIILDKKTTSAEFIRCPKFEQAYYFHYANLFQNKILVYNKNCESILSIKLKRNAVEKIVVSEDELKIAVSYFSDDSIYLYNQQSGELSAVFDTSKLLGEKFIPSFFMDFSCNDKALIVNGFTLREKSKTFLFDIQNL